MPYTPLPTVSDNIDETLVVFTDHTIGSTTVTVASNIIDCYTGEMITLTKSDDQLNGNPITAADNILYFELDGDYYVRNLPLNTVDIRWWNIYADGVTDDSGAIINALATKRKVAFPDKKFKLDSGITTLDYIDIQANGTEFIFDSSVPICIELNGTASSSYTIDANGTLGNNFIISETLAAAVQKGDMILLRDDQAFTTKPSYDNYRGETKEVFRIIEEEDKIFFTTPLHDDYSTAQSFRAYIITPCYCNIEGDFTLTVNQDNFTTSTQRGIDLYLGYKPFLRNIKIRNCTGSSLWLNTCFQADVVANISTALKNTNGYGVALINATCESRLSGTWTNCRHCLTTGGGSADLGGIPHNNKVYDVICSGGDDNASIDCHPPTGFIEFENIMSMGGEIEDADGNTGRPSGINAGAREIVIRGFSAIELASAIVVRPEADINRLDISGVSVYNCNILVEATQSGILRALHLSDIKGTLNSIALSLYSSTEKMTTFTASDCQLTCSSFFYSATGFPLPDVIELSNIRVTGLGVADEGAGIVLNDGSTGIQTVRLNNNRFENFQHGIRINATKNLDELSLANCIFKDNYYHLYAYGSADGTAGSPVERIGLFSSSSDQFSGQSHPTSNSLGIVTMQKNYHKIDQVIVNNYVCNDEPHFFSNTTVLGSLSCGNGVSTSFINIAENIEGYEIMAGSMAAPLIIRGTGSPEGAVAAGYSTLYLRKDAAGAYVKGSASGNTGWTLLS